MYVFQSIHELQQFHFCIFMSIFKKCMCVLGGTVKGLNTTDEANQVLHNYMGTTWFDKTKTKNKRNSAGLWP